MIPEKLNSYVNIRRSTSFENLETANLAREKPTITVPRSNSLPYIEAKADKIRRASINIELVF